jgi:hypothetical protein
MGPPTKRADLICSAVVANNKEPYWHLYFLKGAESTHAEAQVASTPVPAVYGKHESETIPVDSKYE